jgi:S-formylglutathione hydrolase FrmB
MRNQVIGALIVVFPQGFAEGYWADTRDGARPAETQIIRELLPYVEGNFRTLAHRARRGVTGFSMGGFGAFAYALKYPELFSVGIGYDSALDTWETLMARRAYIATAAFGNDESSFDQISPWASATRNAAALVESSRLRGVTGSQYRDFNAAFSDHLTALGIPYDYVETDCAHFYGCPIEREGQNSWALVQAEFSQPATDSAP